MSLFREVDIRGFITESYRIACEHGFHDRELSVEHYLMLVITEIGEAVEADRKCACQSYLEMYYDDIASGTDFKEAFEENIKDTPADELADVCIRLFDLCGTFGIQPLDMPDVLLDKYAYKIDGKSFCERCFMMVSVLTDNRNMLGLDWIVTETLMYIVRICDEMGIDIWEHIRLKMRYNESRPRMHGKSY